MELTTISLKWERVPPNSYRAMDGRFTISRVNLGRCIGSRWILVDNLTKQKESCLTLTSAKTRVEDVLTCESIQGGDQF